MSLNLSNTYPSVKIVDDSYSPVLSNGVIHATLSLTLTDVLYVPKFLMSLLSISQFTKHNNCKIIFSLLIVSFRTCQLGGGSVRGVNEETCTIWMTE